MFFGIPAVKISRQDDLFASAASTENFTLHRLTFCFDLAFFI